MAMILVNDVDGVVAVGGDDDDDVVVWIKDPSNIYCR